MELFHELISQSVGDDDSNSRVDTPPLPLTRFVCLRRDASTVVLDVANFLSYSGTLCLGFDQSELRLVADVL